MSDASNPSLHELYGIAREIVNHLEILNGLDFEKTGFARSIDRLSNILGSLAAKLWKLDSKLGPLESTSVERRIIASRQHKAADLLDEFPNALRAVYSFGMKVRFAVEVAPRYAVNIAADDFGNEVVWQGSYRDHLIQSDLGSDPNKWKAFCTYLKERLSSFDYRKVCTLLSLEKSAAEQAGIAQQTVLSRGDLPDDAMKAILNKSPPAERAFSKLDEIKRALSYLRGVFPRWNDFYSRYGEPIKALDDYGITIPPIVIEANGVAACLAQDTRRALAALDGHQVFPPSLRGLKLEDAIAKFPAWPTGPMSAVRDKAFLENLPVELEQLAKIYVELGGLETQLEYAPLSVLERADVAVGGATAGRPLDPARFRHGPDYRDCTWNGKRHTFSTMQAACVQVPWEERDKGTLEISQQYLLEKAGSESQHLKDVFKGSDAWATMIVRGSTQGSYSLAQPT